MLTSDYSRDRSTVYNDQPKNSQRWNDDISDLSANKKNTANKRQPLKFGMDAILSATADGDNAKAKVDDYACYPYESSNTTSSCLHCFNGPESYFHLEPIYTAKYLPEFYHHTAVYFPSAAAADDNLLFDKGFTNFLVEKEKNTKGNRRKRTWSRAVFSNLQRKGLEKRFQVQKYIMKPDRRQLAATLGLTDAQVKVWFQNRRMKWRNTKQGNDNETKISVK